MSAPKKPARPRRKTRGSDSVSSMDQSAPEVARTVWESVRALYAPQVQGVVDGVVSRGGLSLSELEALEIAEHERIMGMVATLMAQEKADGKPRAVAISGLMSIRLQCRKHLRHIRQALSPVSTPNDTRPMVPESVARAYAINPEDDCGDDLLS